MILSLETSTKVCSIALHNAGDLISSQLYNIDKSHSTLLPSIIGELLQNSGVNKSEIEAISVAAGPGSYTGLRIGTSTAKGLCFGLDIPLISVGTLDLLIETVIETLGEEDLICAMIDARRMEVYTKFIRSDRSIIWDASSLILQPDLFNDFQDKKVFMVGDGIEKCNGFLEHSNLKYLLDVLPNAEIMGRISYQKFLEKDFEDVAYFEPNYLKEFYTKAPSNKFKL